MKMTAPMRTLDHELDSRLSHLLDHGTVTLDVPSDMGARRTLFERVRARGDALYGPTGYRTELSGPRLIIRKAIES